MFWTFFIQTKNSPNQIYCANCVIFFYLSKLIFFTFKLMRWKLFVYNDNFGFIPLWVQFYNQFLELLSISICFSIARFDRCWWQLIQGLWIDVAKINYNSFARRFILRVRNASCVKHSLRCNRFRLVCVFIRQVNNFFDAWLNNHFCTFIAWEQCHVKCTIFQIGR